MPVWSRGWTAVQWDSCCSSVHRQSRKQLLAGKPWQQRTQPRPADTEPIQGLPDSIRRPWWLHSNDSSTIRLSTTAAVRSLGCLEWELAHSDTIRILDVASLHTETAYFGFISQPAQDNGSSLPVLLITTLKYTFFLPEGFNGSSFTKYLLDLC